MSDRQSNARTRRLESRLTRRSAWRWALGSLIAAMATGTARANAQDRQARNEALAAELERVRRQEDRSRQEEALANAARESGAQQAGFVNAVLDQVKALDDKLMQ